MTTRLVAITDVQQQLTIPGLDTMCEFGPIDELEQWYMFANTERTPGALYIRFDKSHFSQYNMFDR